MQLVGGLPRPQPPISPPCPTLPCLVIFAESLLFPKLNGTHYLRLIYFSGKSLVPMTATTPRSGTAIGHSRSRAAARRIPKPRQSLSGCTGKGRSSRQHTFDVCASATVTFRCFTGAGQKGLAHLTAIQTKKVIQRHFSFSFQVNHNGCLS
jgi:hypothetical protein